jgi:hypothetical protein
MVPLCMGRVGRGNQRGPTTADSPQIAGLGTTFWDRSDLLCFVHPLVAYAGPFDRVSLRVLSAAKSKLLSYHNQFTAFSGIRRPACTRLAVP